MAVTKRTTRAAKSAAKSASKKQPLAKKKTPKRQTGPTKIRYRCLQRRCTVTPRHPRVGRVGSMVELIARDTDVDITFTDGSPFEQTHIHIAKNTTETLEVVNGPGTYEYDLTCDKCLTRLSAPPSMIVD